jgi:hypothetical protein
MKFNIEVDTTPEEVRRLMGLPDLSEVHDVYLDKLKKVADKGLTPGHGAGHDPQLGADGRPEHGFHQEPDGRIGRWRYGRQGQEVDLFHAKNGQRRCANDLRAVQRRATCCNCA